MTLKEGMIELGFPKEVSFLADTGIFEIEARKAGLSRELGIDVQIEMTRDQIFEAYEMSGADMFVAPDEIILPTDDKATMAAKAETIKDNLTHLLEFVKPQDTVAVIQGSDPKVIDDLLDFYRQHRINHFALGGVIPLYHHSKTLLEKTLDYVRRRTRKDWLHVFGLPRAGLLKYYLHGMNVDSVDTSLLLYLAARRKYLKGLNAVPVREASFKECSCAGCRNLSEKMDTRSSVFFVNLYIHNLSVSSEFANSNPASSAIEKTLESSESQSRGRNEAKLIHSQPDEFEGWMTAMELLQHHRKR